MVNTRAGNVDKHPGRIAQTTMNTRRPAHVVAEEKKAKLREKEAKVQAKHDLKVAKAQRLEQVTVNATAKDVSYATPVMHKGPAQQLPPKRALKRTESVADLSQEAQVEPTGDVSMPPPPIPSRKRKTIPAEPVAGAPRIVKSVYPFRDGTGTGAPANQPRTLKSASTSGGGASDSAPATKYKSLGTTVAKHNAGPTTSQKNPGFATLAPANKMELKIAGPPRPRKLKQTNHMLGGDTEMGDPNNVPACSLPSNTTAPSSKPAPSGHPARSSRPVGLNVAQATSNPAPAAVPAVSDDSVTEDDSQAPQPVDDDSATEDDLQAPVFEPFNSKSEFADPEPPKKKAKTQSKSKGKGKVVVDQKDVPKKSNKRSVVETTFEAGSDVEIVETVKPVKKKPAAKQPIVKGIFPLTGHQTHKMIVTRPVRLTGTCYIAFYRLEIQRLIPTLMSILTLDQTTLFYWNLSNDYLKPKFSGTKKITTWTLEVSEGLKSHSHRSDSTPPLTGSNATSVTRPPSSVRSRTSSALTNGIKISEANEDGLLEHGAISDRDETVGEEFEAKKKSPVKGQVRLTSQVRN